MAASCSLADEQDGDRLKRGRSVRKGHVKRPMNAFIIWGRAERRRLAAENPLASNGQLSRILGHRWNTMTDDEREPFSVEAERLRNEHRRQYPDYKYRPRPPRRRFLDATPGHDLDHVGTTSSFDSRREKRGEGKDSGLSPELISILQQCSINDLLNALVLKVASSSHILQCESDAASTEGGCSKDDTLYRCQDDSLYFDPETYRIGNPLDDDLVDVNFSPLADDELSRKGTDGAAKLCTIDQSNDEWKSGRGKPAAPYGSLNGRNAPRSDYSQPKAVCAASWLFHSQDDNEWDLHGQRGTLAAVELPSSNASSSLTNDTSLYSWGSYDKLAPTFCDIPAAPSTASTHAVSYTSAGTAFAPHDLPFIGWS